MAIDEALHPGLVILLTCAALLTGYLQFVRLLLSYWVADVRENAPAHQPTPTVDGRRRITRIPGHEPRLPAPQLQPLHGVLAFFDGNDNAAAMKS